MEDPASPERWRQIQRLFAEVVGLEPERREARLERACRDDPDLRKAVEALLDQLAGGDGLASEHEPGRAADERGFDPAPTPEGGAQGELIKGRYRILKELGRGAMGVVYKAEDTKLDCFVTLKFLHHHLAADRKARQRFIDEAKAASDLNHPNICRVKDHDEAEDGRLFLVMAYYGDGCESLEAVIERGPLPVKQAVDIARQIAAGLAAAHRPTEHRPQGIIHRDIKPSNVLITTEGTAIILDFGIAKMADSGLTGTGDILGTLAYMSPEHLRDGTVCRGTDLWALGVTLYEMLAGEPPFKEDYGDALRNVILKNKPLLLKDRRKDVPEALAEVVYGCLKKEPEVRYQSAEEIEADLKRVAEGHGLAWVVRAIHRFVRRLRSVTQRRRVSLAMLGLGTLGLVLALLLWPRHTAALDWLGFRVVPVEKHIAVLPFQNVGDDPESQAFSEGLVETLVSKLTQMEQFQGKLWVVPSGEIRKNGITTASDAHRALGVNLVVTGSVQRNAGRVRLTLNLLNARKQRQLRAAVIDTPLADIHALQDGVVSELEGMLNIELNSAHRLALAAGGTTVPNSYDFYVQGLGYLQRYENPENIDHAIGLFERALERDTSYALSYAALGNAYWLKYRISNDSRWVEQAVKNSEVALTLNQRLAPVHVTLSRIYRGTGRFDDALREAHRALDLEPSNYASYFALAQAYEARGELEEAEKAYTKAIEQKPTYWEGYNELGRFYINYGRYEAAAIQFSQVVDLVPDSHWGYQNLGAAYMNLEKNDEAREMLERAMFIRPNADAALNLGTLYYNEGRFADAARAYEQVLRFDERGYLTWGNLGAAYRRIPNERDKASAAFRRAILSAEELRQVNPHDPLLLSDVATYHAYLGEMDQARLLIEQALALDPQNVDVAVSAGIVYEKLGDRGQALHWVGKALEGGYPRSMLDEPELEDLRADPRFLELVEANVGPSPAE